ncbi:MAG: hypothetical protein UY63_C0017G0035 [Parcubacteria group bacterium GW2011_GWA2_51_10]|nr:MAG: hypothetical protein UY63_C0017G0035 [Parcubacteria group bacterium GW2011_GWA2_51_10]
MATMDKFALVALGRIRILGRNCVEVDLDAPLLQFDESWTINPNAETISGHVIIEKRGAEMFVGDLRARRHRDRRQITRGGVGGLTALSSIRSFALGHPNMIDALIACDEICLETSWGREKSERGGSRRNLYFPDVTWADSHGRTWIRFMYPDGASWCSAFRTLNDRLNGRDYFVTLEK